MKLVTKYLGEIEINQENIIHFESGLPGFIDEKQFIIIDLPDNQLLKILQSTTTPELAFIITNPHYFYEEYEFKLDESTIKALEIKTSEDVIIFSIMTLKQPFDQSTINLQAPIVINSRKKRGKQFIINNSNFSMRAQIDVVNSQEEGSE